MFPNGCNYGVSAAAAADVPAGSPPPGIFPAPKRERAPIGPDRPRSAPSAHTGDRVTRLNVAVFQVMSGNL